MKSIENPIELFEHTLCADITSKVDAILQEWRQSYGAEKDPVKCIDKMMYAPEFVGSRVSKAVSPSYKKYLEEYKRMLSRLPQHCLSDTFPNSQSFGSNLFAIYKNMVEYWPSDCTQDLRSLQFCVVIHGKALPGVSQVKHMRVNSGDAGEHTIHSARVQNIQREFEMSSCIYIARHLATREIQIDQSQEEILANCKKAGIHCLNLEETLALARSRPDLFVNQGMLVLGSKYCGGKHILRVQNHQEKDGATNELKEKIIVSSVDSADHIEKFHFATALFFVDEFNGVLGKK